LAFPLIFSSIRKEGGKKKKKGDRTRRRGKKGEDRGKGRGKRGTHMDFLIPTPIFFFVFGPRKNSHSHEKKQGGGKKKKKRKKSRLAEAPIEPIAYSNLDSKALETGGKKKKKKRGRQGDHREGKGERGGKKKG